MSATISEPNTSQVQVSGAYKDFTSGSGSTTTVIQYDSGEAPASGDAGRFLMWRVDTSLTSTWQIRYIESATSTSVTVGDGGFSSAPPSSAEFRMSSNLEDIKLAVNNAAKLRANGTHYEFVNREWVLTNGAFLADVDKSIGMTNRNTTEWHPPAFAVRRECAVQFGRLNGGEANDSVETTQGCRLALQSTSKSKLIFGTAIGNDLTGAGVYDATGCILNFYGCQIEASHGSNPLFIRAGGALRMIGTICDGDIGGRFYHDASELVDCRFSGNTSGGHAWSSATSPTRDIDNIFFFGNDTAIKSFQAWDATFKNCRFADSNDTIIQANADSDLNFKFIDCTTFAESKISDNKGNYTQGKSINYEITDSGGTGLDDVLVAVYDKDGLVQTGVQTSSSGAVSEIQAIFFNKPDGSGASNLAPFDIRVRKYGYTYLGFSSSVSDKIKQEVRLVENSELVSNKTQAQAISGISLNFATSTLTLTENHSAQALYDYYQYQLGESANMQYAEDFTKSGSAFDLGDWNLVVDGCTYTGDITTSGTITRPSSGKIIGSATDVSGTIVLLPWGIKNIEATSRFQLYNITKGAVVVTQKLTGIAYNKAILLELYGHTYAVTLKHDGAFIDATSLEVIASGSASSSWTLQSGVVQFNVGSGVLGSALTQDDADINVDLVQGHEDNTVTATATINSSEFNDEPIANNNGNIDVSGSYNASEIAVNDIIRLRVTCVVGAEAMLPIEVTGVATSTGITFSVDQKADEVYNANGINGSTVSTLTADYSSPMGVDVSDADGTASVKEIYAFFVYSTTTEDGVHLWFGGMRAIDNANYEVVTARSDIKIQNIGTNAVIVSDGRLFRDDSASVLYAEDGDKPISMDSGALVTSVQPQVEAALNSNAKISSTNNNSKLIPSLL